MENDPEGVTQKDLERILLEMQGKLMEPVILKPTKLWVHPDHLRSALRLLGWIKAPVRKARGTRARKRAVYWRGK